MPGRPKKSKVMRKAQSHPYHHGSLREALLEAALALIGRKGSQALSLREVARRAGVSQAAPYRHFKSREALLAAVAEEGFGKMAEEMEAATASCRGDPVKSLEELGVAYVRFAATHPSHFRVMFGSEVAGPGRYPKLEQASRASFQHLLGGMEALQAAQVAAPAPPLEMALPAWGLVQGLSSLLVDGRLPGVHAAPGQFSKDAEMLVRLAARKLLQGLEKR